jgi:hypothetical protein
MTVFTGGALESSGMALICLFAIFLAGYLLAVHDKTRRENREKRVQENFEEGRAMLTQDDGLGPVPNSRAPAPGPGGTAKPPAKKPTRAEISNQISRVYREIYGIHIPDSTLQSYLDDYGSSRSQFDEAAFKRMLVKQRRWEHTNTIKAAYAKVMRRLPTPVEIDKYIDMFYTGSLGTQAQLEDMLLVDPEHADGPLGKDRPADDKKDNINVDAPRYQTIIEIFKQVLERHPKAAELEFYNSMMSRTPSFDEVKLRSALTSSREYDMLTMNQKNDVLGDVMGIATTRQLEFNVKEMYKRVHGQEPQDRATIDYMMTKFKGFNMDEAAMVQYMRSMKSLEEQGTAGLVPRQTCAVIKPVLDTTHIIPRTQNMPLTTASMAPSSYLGRMTDGKLYDKYTNTPNNSMVIMDKVSVSIPQVYRAGVVSPRVGAGGVVVPQMVGAGGVGGVGGVGIPSVHRAGVVSPRVGAGGVVVQPRVGAGGVGGVGGVGIPSVHRAGVVSPRVGAGGVVVPQVVGAGGVVVQPGVVVPQVVGAGGVVVPQVVGAGGVVVQPRVGAGGVVVPPMHKTVKGGPGPVVSNTATATAAVSANLCSASATRLPQINGKDQNMGKEPSGEPCSFVTVEAFTQPPMSTNMLFCQVAPKVFQAPSSVSKATVSLDRMLCSSDRNMLDPNVHTQVYEQKNDAAVIAAAATTLNPAYQKATSMRFGDNLSPPGADADYVRFLNERKTYDKDLLSIPRMGGVDDMTTGVRTNVDMMSAPSSGGSLQGTPIWDSMNTEVGSILPRFKYQELPPSY